MPRKAVIFDLDNTIYPVASIAKELFASLFRLLSESGELNNLDEVKHDLMRKPYQVVALKHGFSAGLTKQGLRLLEGLRYEGPISPFDDYAETRSLSVKKFLVTTGFQALQQSKIEGMGLENDFTEIHIVDPQFSSKKEVFASILSRHRLAPAEVLVVGDDPDSELKAANELGIAAVLYDKEGLQKGQTSFPHITGFQGLAAFLKEG